MASSRLDNKRILSFYTVTLDINGTVNVPHHQLRDFQIGQREFAIPEPLSQRIFGKDILVIRDEGNFPCKSRIACCPRQLGQLLT